MAQSRTKYQCALCEYSCEQKSHIDSHKLTRCHLDKCEEMIIKLKTDKSLFNKYITELKIFEDDDKTMSMLRGEIINRLSCLYGPQVHINETVREVPLYLNTELTQFTKGKTEQTLNKICERYLLNSNSTDAHIIEIIVTNKSLLETKQWQIRTTEKFKPPTKKGGVMNENIYLNIDVDILSSDDKSKYHNIDKYISKILMAKTKDELPNILIVCFHKTRIEDILKLFKVFSGRTIMLQDVKLKFHLSFDEPDANIGLCSLFLKSYKDYMNLLVAIEFITATPYEHFWKMLQQNGIVKLINPHSSEQPTLNEKSYVDDLQQYFQIKEHNHLAFNYKTQNPLEYIENVFESRYPIFEMDEEGNKIQVGEKPYIDMEDPTRKIIFSPAHLYIDKEGVGSHAEVVEFYIELGFTVYLSNGEFKGFINPNGKRLSLDDFNEKYKIKGELRDTLRKWAQLHPIQNLAITGYWTIERGITFQTDGFNFTHAIISDYHKNLLNKLVQLIGRLTGNKDYITQQCNLICPQHIIDKVDSLVTKTIELRTENPENYISTDFSDKYSSIPVKLTFIDEEFRQLFIASITGKRNYKSHLHSLLKSGYREGKIILEDRNNIYVFTNDTKDKSGETKSFDDIHKKISNVKMYTESDSAEARRFKQFNNAFNTYKPTSQTGEPGEYSIDLAKDRYEYNGFVHDVNIAWITFKHE